MSHQDSESSASKMCRVEGKVYQEDPLEEVRIDFVLESVGDPQGAPLEKGEVVAMVIPDVYGNWEADLLASAVYRVKVGCCRHTCDYTIETPDAESAVFDSLVLESVVDPAHYCLPPVTKSLKKTQKIILDAEVRNKTDKVAIAKIAAIVLALTVAKLIAR